MTIEQITAAVNDLVALAQEGRWELAYEKYYHAELKKTDLDGVPVKGITQNIEIGRAFASKISNIRDFSCIGKVLKGTQSILVWSLDFDVDGSPFKVVEVAIQNWEQGRIRNERFFA